MAAPIPGAVRRRPRALTVTLATLGLLVVTAAGATVTVAVGKPDHSRARVAAAGLNGSSTPAPGTSASPSDGDGPSDSPSPVPLPSLTLAPAPSSTLHGTVSGPTHGGDLRFFLLPIPDGGESYGSPDGIALTVDDLAKDYGQSTQIKSVLDSYGYQEAAFREYRSADGKMDVSARLMRFSSADNAKAFLQGDSYGEGQPTGVDGDSDAKGYVFKPDQQAYTGGLVGLSSVGDVEYEVRVSVKGDPDKALLADAMRRQHDRLVAGG
ncbi:hypothetical protein [Kitasatospora kifunensis]|uniref:Uncharacterized protein n=1 Tax=Kitasatospora kifunensis TaxID=58351 RepID=A0A7W7R2R4_KITKI|nr:hypothetical protein [Kitasatospora kifunensis]MBB4924324.1 hypothetical protein [Kitasatospora kifunensis]